VAADELGMAGRQLPPRQLPAAPPWLVGRDDEYASLHHALTTAPTAPIAVLEGPGGIGKSSLALHWAHLHAELFPDGHLYVDLGGFGRAGTMPDPLSVLQAFLSALGVPQQAVPATEEAVAALYRSMLADRRLLIVLDNVAELAQVEKLLPGSPSCPVLVTSRNSLIGLRRYGAVTVRLDVLPPDRSRELFTRSIGIGAQKAEPEALSALTELCSGLPLALSLLAARVVSEPEVPLEVLAEELSDGGLSVFDVGDGSASLRTVLSWSYRTLNNEEARAFRLLGAAPVDELGVAAAASVLDVSRQTVSALLRALAMKNLLTQFRPRRYRFHDLVRLYARKLAVEVGSIAESDEANSRLVAFYAYTALDADRTLYPHRSGFELGASRECIDSLRFPGEEQALSWFDEEHCQLSIVQYIAAYQDRPDLAWLLCRALDTYQFRTGRLLDNLRTSELGVKVARRLDSQVPEVLALRQLGRALTRADKLDRAAKCLREALALAGAEAGERAHTLHDLARVSARLGDHRSALDYARQAVEQYEYADNATGAAHALNAVARQCAELGDHERATGSAQRALALHDRHGNRSGMAVTWATLGFIATRTGSLGEAERCYGKALELSREQHNTYFEAEVTERLAYVHGSAGRPELAAEELRVCCRLYARQHRLQDHERAKLALVSLEPHPNPEENR
jgi:tetratricopeptide (TPR) repeat protein